jgi:hypothetical protein
MAAGKGFGSLSVDTLTAGNNKQRSLKKMHRREHISRELQQLQAEELHASAKGAPASLKQSTGNKPSPASSSQQQMSPEEVALQAKDLQEKVLKLQEDIRSSSFFRLCSFLLAPLKPWLKHGMVHGPPRCKNGLSHVQGLSKHFQGCRAACKGVWRGCQNPR